MPKISDSEKEARKERILEGARRCFARYGYEGATVVRLEQEIGLSRGAIFNWFESKEELFIQLAARDNDRLLGTLATEGASTIIRKLAEDEEPEWLAVYIEFGRRLRTDADLRARWEKIASDEARIGAQRWIDDGQRDGLLRSDVSSADIGRFLGLVLDGIAVQRALGWEAPPADLIVRLVGDAIDGPKAKRGRRQAQATGSTRASVRSPGR